MSLTADGSPRDAATVLVLRRPTPTTTELYFVHRAAKSPFMPSTWVFPGGRVDAADGDTGSDAAFRRAAARECHEEAGLRVDPAALRWIDTWLTPSAEPRRYTARFYLAEVSVAASTPRIDGHEVVAGRWCTPDSMLEAWRAETADLPPPTLCVVQALADRPAVFDDLQTDALAVPILPKLVDIDDRPTIVLPHDPQYDALVGESHPAPARTTNYPRRLERRGQRWVPLIALAWVVVFGGCRDGSVTPESEDNRPATAVQTPEAETAKPTEAEPSRGVLGWCDPDARGAAYGNGTRGLDLAALATVFALPPRAREIALADAAVTAALATLDTAEGAPLTSVWGDRWVAFAPPLATAPFVVRELVQPVARLEASLVELGFKRSDQEGFPLLTSDGAFPWKVVILDAKSVAFVPRSEIGSGLTPLTAARDLPPSELSKQITTEAAEKDMVFTSYVTGPMLHWDLSGDVFQAQFALREWQGGLDGGVALIVGEEHAVGSGATTLHERPGVGETERVRELMRKVAFEPQGPAVTGRLQIPATDVPRASH